MFSILNEEPEGGLKTELAGIRTRPGPQRPARGGGAIGL